MAIKLIVGLRNPGSAYEYTRHNAGAWFVDALAQKYNIHFKSEKKLHADLGNFTINDHLCRVVLPLTFMNHSGQPIREISQFYRIKPEEILIAHDELDLPAGRIKLKRGGGNGGHNGLKDTINQLGSSDFYRLRLGIGHPGHRDLVTNYVLGKPKPDEVDLIFNAIHRAVDNITPVLRGEFATAMNQINS